MILFNETLPFFFKYEMPKYELVTEEFFTFFLDDICRICFNHYHYVYIKKKIFSKKDIEIFS